MEKGKPRALGTVGLSRKIERPGEKGTWKRDQNMGRKGRPFIKSVWGMLANVEKK